MCGRVNGPGCGVSWECPNKGNHDSRVDIHLPGFGGSYEYGNKGNEGDKK